MTKNSVWVALAIAGSFAISNGTAYAGSATAIMGVTATVSASCNMSVNAMAFPTYSLPLTGTNGGSAVALTLPLTVTCTNGTIATIALDMGQHQGDAVVVNGVSVPGSRQMVPGFTGAWLTYGLYQDAAHSIFWGPTVASSVTVTGTGNTPVAGLNIYGYIPGGQTPPVGTYSDTVTITLTF